MTHLWRLRGLTWRQLAGDVGHTIAVHDVFGQAAKLSFYFLLALFPLLLALTTVFGLFAQSEELRSALLGYFRTVVPRSAFQLVLDTLDQISSGAGGGKLAGGLAAALWAGASGMVAVAEGLNRAYEINDERPWWKIRIVAAGLTVAFTVFTVAAVTLILGGAKAGALIARRFGLEDAFELAWNIGRWPLALFAVLIAVNLLYRFLPDLKQWKWRWLTPGAFIAVGLWILASLGFRSYLRFFNSYNTTYGSLGAVIILLLWFYLTGAAILIGAEVNSEIENAAARAGEDDARLPGERQPGEKRRWNPIGFLFNR